MGSRSHLTHEHPHYKDPETSRALQDQEGLDQFGPGGLLEFRSLHLPVHELGVGAHVDSLTGLMITLQMIVPARALGEKGR